MWQGWETLLALQRFFIPAVYFKMHAYFNQLTSELFTLKREIKIKRTFKPRWLVTFVYDTVCNPIWFDKVKLKCDDRSIEL